MTFRMSAVAVCRSSASLRLVEQPGVLDRDHGLVGEGLQQLDMMGRERPGLDARDSDDTDRDAGFIRGTYSMLRKPRTAQFP